MHPRTSSPKQFVILATEWPSELTAGLARWKAAQASEHNHEWLINEEYHLADESECCGSENAGPDWEKLLPSFCSTASVRVLGYQRLTG